MWFAAKLLFESSVQHDDGHVMQEESIRLIQAIDESQAHANAMSLGASERTQFPNDQGETVVWRFISVLEIQDLCEDTIFDGVEVFSTLKWREVTPIEN